MSDLAPVVIFAYNRADHLRVLLSSLAVNFLAKESKIFLYIDGPKKIEDVSAIDNVFGVANEFLDKFGDLLIIRRDFNVGLAGSIIQGVSDAVDKYGKVIVLEDDLILDKNFLVFMNKCLDWYEYNNSVMHVSGYCYPVDFCTDDELFFLRVPMCWGWATWKRAWAKFKKDNSVTVSEIEKKYINFDGFHDYYAQFNLNLSGKINTWFIYWYISCVKNNGLSVFPKNTFVVNNGFDASGTHGVSVDLYNSPIVGKVPENINLYVHERSEIVLSHKKYFYKIAGIKLKFRLIFKFLGN